MPGEPLGGLRPDRTILTGATRRAVLAASIGVLLLLGTPLLFGRFFFGTDMTRSDLGLMCAISRHLATGEPFGISPWIGNGIPIRFDVQAQVLYPLRWLVATLPPDAASSLEAVLHLAIGAGATAWLARTFRARPLAAACAGLAFGLCGSAIDLLQHATYMVGAAWVPLAWASARRSLSAASKGPGPLLLAGTALGSALLGGEPQAFVMSLGLVAFECLRVLIARRRRALGDVARVGVAVAGAALIGSLLWAGALHEMSLSRRSGALDVEMATRWSLSWDTWLALILPSILREAIYPGIELKSLFFSARTPMSLYALDDWNSSPYLGALLIGVLVAGAGVRRVRAALIVFILSLWFALGSSGGLLPALMAVFPPLRIFRYPAKYFLVAHLAAVVAGVLILDLASRSRRIRRKVVIASVSAVVCLGATTIAVRALSADLDSAWRSATDVVLHPDLPPLSAVLTRNLLHAIAACAAPLALAALGLRVRPALLLLPVLVLADYAAAAPSWIRLGPPLAELRSPLTALIDEREPIPVLCQGEGSMAAQAVPKTASPFEPMERVRLTAQPHTNACDGLSHAAPYSPLESRTVAELNAALHLNLLSVSRALGCTHTISRTHPRPESGAEVVPIARYAPPDRPGIKVYRIREPIPRAFVARSPQLFAGDIDAASAAARAPDLAATLQIVDDPARRLEPEVVLPDGLGVRALELEARSRNELTLRAEGRGGAILGVRTVFQLGWTARQAGRELTVVRVASTQVGVVVPDVALGPVTLRYEPPLAAASWAAAIAGALLVGAAALWRRMRTAAQARKNRQIRSTSA